MDWCAICYELVDDYDRVRISFCSHVYHYQCVDPWIRSSQDCPRCTKPVTVTTTYCLYGTSPGRTEARCISGGGSLNTRTLRTGNEQLNTSIQSMNLLLASVREELSARNSHVELLQAQLQSMKTREQENITLIESLRWNVSSATNELASSQRTIFYLKQQVDDYTMETKKLRESNRSLVHQLQESVSAVNTTAAKRQVDSSFIINNEQEKLALENVGRLARDLNSAKMELVSSQRTIFDHKLQVDGYTKETNKLTESNRSLVQRLQQFVSAVNTTAANRQVDSSFIINNEQEKLALENVGRLARDLKSAKDELARDQWTILDLKQQVDGYTKKTNILRESNRHLLRRFQEFVRAVKTTAAERQVDSSFIIYDHQEKLALKIVERMARVLASLRAELMSDQDHNDIVMRLDRALLRPMENNVALYNVGMDEETVRNDQVTLEKNLYTWLRSEKGL